MFWLKVNFCCFCLSLIFFSPLSANGQNPTADEVLGRYVEALGGKDAIEKITSRISKGVMTDRRGNKSPIEQYSKLSELGFLTISPNSSNEFKQWFDGTKGFTADAQNGTREMTGAFLIHWRRNNNLHLPVKLREFFNKIEFKEKIKKSNLELNCLAMTTPIPSEEIWCFNDRSNLLYSRIFTVNGGKIELIYDDYRTIEGVKMPFLITVSDPNGTQKTEWQEIRLNVPIDDAKFGPTKSKNALQDSVKADSTTLYDVKTEEVTAPSGQKYMTEKGFLRVPENRTKSNSKTIELAVLRLKTKTVNPAPPLIYIAGGPGQSALGELRFPFMARLFEKILQTRDVILFDQRGTGQSRPRLVWAGSESLPPDVFVSEEKAVSYIREQHSKAVTAFKEQNIDLTGYNTNESADDINDLRKAVNAKKVALLGFSYGTHLGLATIRRHSEHLDSVILLGTEGLNHTYKLPSTYDAQLKKLSELAAEDETVKDKVPDMFGLLKRVLDKLDKAPVTITVMDYKKNRPVELTIGKYGLQILIRFDIGDSNDFVDFPRWFYSMGKGDYSILKNYAEKRYNQLGQGVSGMSVMMDLFSGAAKDRLEQIKTETKDAMLGDAVNYLDLRIADIWGNPDLGDDFRKPLKTTVRTLFVSGTLDSNAPTAQTEEIRKGFTNNAHLILEYGGHEDLLPNEKIQQMIVEFVNGNRINDQIINQVKPKFTPIP